MLTVGLGVVNSIRALDDPGVSDTLGSLVKGQRERLGMTQVTLAAQSGVSQNVISRIETGAYKETPPPEVLAGLSDALGIPESEMLASMGYRIEDPSEPDAADRESERAWRRLTKEQRDVLLGVAETFQKRNVS